MHEGRQHRGDLRHAQALRAHLQVCRGDRPGRELYPCHGQLHRWGECSRRSSPSSQEMSVFQLPNRCGFYRVSLAQQLVQSSSAALRFSVGSKAKGCPWCFGFLVKSFQNQDLNPLFDQTIPTYLFISNLGMCSETRALVLSVFNCLKSSVHVCLVFFCRSVCNLCQLLDCVMWRKAVRRYILLTLGPVAAILMHPFLSI